MAKIIGRKKEVETLDQAFHSEDPEFIAVYGRRRVGKTYLIRNLFKDKKNTIFFYASGIKDGSLEDQIQSFLSELFYTFDYRGPRAGLETNWNNVFRLLTELIRKAPAQKIVLFFDEFPWMVTRRSKLLQMLDYYWNRHWSMDERVKLIVCGSSASWILNKIINNRGGLYNRVTQTIHLMPFNLQQTQEFLRAQKVRLSERNIADLYMVLGGIPYYLKKVKPGLSAAQVIEELGFTQNSFLLREFENLYATLFDSEGIHIELARSIARHRYGISLKQLVEEVGVTKGGTISKWLKELEDADFISRYTPYGTKAKGIYYKMDDEYSLFYFKWIEPIKKTLLARSMRAGYWLSLHNSPAWASWAGYAFETICFKHISNISRVLKLTPLAIPYTWRYVPKKGNDEQGAQIDLLFEREDNAITICEIKYTKNQYTLDKKAFLDLVHKQQIFKQRTKTSKSIFFALIVAQEIKKTLYSEEYIQAVVTLKDLFR